MRPSARRSPSTSKIGMSKSKIPNLCLTRTAIFIGLSRSCFFALPVNPVESADPEFDDYQRHFASMEKAAEALIKDNQSVHGRGHEYVPVSASMLGYI